MTETTTQTAGQRRYAKVNDLWPASLPPLTEQEAVSAAKRLYRLGTGKAFTGRIVLTSGNRYTWVRRGTLYVNASAGWKRLVHDLSHLTHQRRNPGKSGHHWTHLPVERQMIETVIERGWLDGKLRRPEPATPDPAATRHARVLARIAAWERKQRRAETALAKLYRSKAQHERRRAAA